MALTEKEAADKWCPMDRGAGSGCVGSRCMMWRRMRGSGGYRHILCANVSATEEPKRPANVPPSWTWSPFVDTEGDLAGWTESEEDWSARQRGYCGLAGAEDQVA